MLATSPCPGTTPPDHLLASFQLPVEPSQNIVALPKLETEAVKKKRNKKNFGKDKLEVRIPD